MFKVEPNLTKNRPDELPYLIRNLENMLITRYCSDLVFAEKEVERLNGTRHVEASPAPEAESTRTQDVAIGENLSLF